MVNGSLNSSLTGKRRFGHVIFSLLPVLKIPITQHLQLTRQGLLFPPYTCNMQTVKSEETPLKPRLIALVIFNDFEMYWPHYGTVQLSIPLIRWCAPIRNSTLKYEKALVRGIHHWRPRPRPRCSYDTISFSVPCPTSGSIMWPGLWVLFVSPQGLICT